MATSQNGYKPNDRSLIASYSVPGGKIAMRKGDVATVLVYFAKRFHSEVEPLVWPGNWGYAERTIRGSSRTLSNHASGTAIDLNAPKHPLGKVGTFSSAQRGRIRKILNDCEGVLRWGGDYNGRKDEMHVEINKGTAAVAALAKKIKDGKKPGPSGGATASGGGSSSPTYKAISGSTPLVKLYHKGEPVNRIQKAVGVKVDGYYGPATRDAVKSFQKKHGLAADGIVGPDTWKAINGGKASAPKSDPFPLPKGHFYYTQDSRNTVHSGYWEKDRAAIRKIQKAVGAVVDGRYGPSTKSHVQAKQRKLGVSADGAVGATTWAKLF